MRERELEPSLDRGGTYQPRHHATETAAGE